MESAESGPHDTTRIPGLVPGSGEHDDTTTREPTAAVEPVEHGPVLILQRGPRAGERLPLDVDRTLVGRHPEADICLEDVTVSRKHAEFLAHEGGHIVRDVGSLNGTYVNGQRINSTALRAGDEVQIGKYRFTYHHPSPNQQPRTPPEA